MFARSSRKKSEKLAKKSIHNRYYVNLWKKRYPYGVAFVYICLQRLRFVHKSFLSLCNWELERALYAPKFVLIYFNDQFHLPCAVCALVVLFVTNKSCICRFSSQYFIFRFLHFSVCGDTLVGIKDVAIGVGVYGHCPWV